MKPNEQESVKLQIIDFFKNTSKEQVLTFVEDTQRQIREDNELWANLKQQ